MDTTTEPSFTVIIPARNAASTLAACLASIRASSLLPRETVVVDDGSVDGTADMAARSGCTVLRINHGKGPMQPRFEGARIAQTPILVFVDADVRVKPNTFRRLAAHFQDPRIDAVTGLLGRRGGHPSFFSAYKNEYMNYIFKMQPRESTFVYGSLWAIRREKLIFFEPMAGPFGSLASDSEMGFRLRAQGSVILLDPKLEVIHMKRYNFAKIITNDFVIPFLFAQLLKRYGSLLPIARERRFSHASLAQVLAAAAAFAALGGLIYMAWSFSVAALAASVACLSLFYVYWAPFLAKVARRGLGFALKTGLFLPLDAAVQFAGMTAGLLYARTR